MKLIFFGSSSFSISVLESLQKRGITPSGIVTTPYAPQGRGREVKPNVVALYAQFHNIPFLAPQSIRGEHAIGTESSITALGGEVFLVASYGKIIPKNILDLPDRGVLNIHPSLLPKYRGPSPMQSMILDETLQKDGIGISIMLLDEQMDHGPIVAQKVVQPLAWPMKEESLELFMADEGAALFSECISDWMNGTKEAIEQNHDEATYTHKFSKEDARIQLTSLADTRDEHLHEEAFRKFCAFHRSPGVWFTDSHAGREIRVKITDVAMVGTMFTPLKVVPEGRKEMNYQDYLRGKK
ncbi:MAG TPA: methionyl-tRNA formyltransferase [Candidatus Paceibacterota bacterium]|nr:methionyl-tRNA formyltransferase [Candidatus Paceibacterota bacterium]